MALGLWHLEIKRWTRPFVHWGWTGDREFLNPRFCGDPDPERPIATSSQWLGDFLNFKVIIRTDGR